MTLHEQVDELVAGFALGAVDDAEAAMVRRHLPDCPECQATLLRMTEVVAVLPLSLEEVAPPPDLKNRVLARGNEPGLPAVLPMPVSDDRTAGKLLFLRRVPGWAPVAAAAVLVVAMFGWTVSQRPRPTTPAPDMQATLIDGSHSGVGNVTYIADKHLALVSFQQLSAPAPGRTYELWVIPAGGHPVASGVFLPDADGSKVLVLNRQIAHGDTIAVTVEAPGGAAQPTSAPVISAQL